MIFLKETTSKNLYFYDGPIYNDITKLAEFCSYYTHANSKIEARKNIINQIKKEKHEKFIDIETGFIRLIPKEVKINKSQEQPEQLKFEI